MLICGKATDVARSAALENFRGGVMNGLRRCKLHAFVIEFAATFGRLIEGTSAQRLSDEWTICSDARLKAIVNPFEMLHLPAKAPMLSIKSYGYRN